MDRLSSLHSLCQPEKQILSNLTVSELKTLASVYPFSFKIQGLREAIYEESKHYQTQMNPQLEKKYKKVFTKSITVQHSENKVIRTRNEVIRNMFGSDTLHIQLPFTFRNEVMWYQEMAYHVRKNLPTNLQSTFFSNSFVSLFIKRIKMLHPDCQINYSELERDLLFSDLLMEEYKIHIGTNEITPHPFFQVDPTEFVYTTEREGNILFL